MSVPKAAIRTGTPFDASGKGAGTETTCLTARSSPDRTRSSTSGTVVFEADDQG